MKQHHKSLRRQCAAFLCSFAAAASALSLSVRADEHYDVYNYNRLGEAIPSQAGYLAERTVSGTDLGTSALSNPQDLFRDSDGSFYLADTGNQRILKIDRDFSRVLHIYDRFTMPDGSSTALKTPKGVFRSPDTGLLYIADTDNSRALVCTEDGSVVQEITKPDSALYDAQLTFLPQKILCDRAGNIYIILSNTTKGAAMFSSDGEFIGYYGANAVARTAKVLADHFWNAIASEEERRHSTRTAPTAFDNFDLDTEKGFIFTSTSSEISDTDTVKKVNPEGYNLFSYMSDYKWGDLFSTWYSGTSYKTKIIDLDIGADLGDPPDHAVRRHHRHIHLYARFRPHVQRQDPGIISALTSGHGGGQHFEILLYALHFEKARHPRVHFLALRGVVDLRSELCDLLPELVVFLHQLVEPVEIRRESVHGFRRVVEHLLHGREQPRHRVPENERRPHLVENRRDDAAQQGGYGDDIKEFRLKKLFHRASVTSCDIPSRISFLRPSR